MAKKVIEQGIRYNIEIGLDSSGDAIILTQGTDLHRSGIGIEKSKATEVAKAICPKYQELEESYAKVLEALKDVRDFLKEEASIKMRNGANRDVVDYYDDKACEIDRLIQQSETK